MTERKLKKLDTLFAAPRQEITAAVQGKHRLLTVSHDLINAHPKHWSL